MKIEYKLTKNFQQVTVSVDIPEASTEDEILQYKTWLKEQAVEELNDVCSRLGVDTQKTAAPAPAKSGYTQQNTPRYAANNYPTKVNNAPKTNCSPKQRNVLLSNGYTAEEIDAMSFDQVKAAIGEIFGK